jgi:radical SAM protein with 4Fe4S-binding SPASM domain
MRPLSQLILHRSTPSQQVLNSQLLPSAGLYHFQFDQDDEHTRVHLRLDPGQNDLPGSGVLLINASQLLHLNPTAALMAYLVLAQIPEEKAVTLLSKLYHAKPSVIYNDYTHFTSDLQQIVHPKGACPVCELELETTPAFQTQPSAPYRMDLALTYRCNDDCAHCYNVRPRDFSELPTQDWFAILDRLWEIGIPHIVFTGGEPTLRQDLPLLIAHAERNGQITGLNTNARRLSDPHYVDELVNAGLDHVQITVESHDPAIHDFMVRTSGAWKQTIAGLRNALANKLFVMTNTTMLSPNSPYLAQTLNFLAELGVPTIGLNALIYSGRGLSAGTGLAESDLLPLLELAREHTQQSGQRLVWYTPTQYCHFDPVQQELGIKGCTAALYNMCVEPDGNVIPCQSYYQPLGNLLKDPWPSIWDHDLAKQLRERRYILEKCVGCALLKECGGGCPLTLQAIPNTSANLGDDITRNRI